MIITNTLIAGGMLYAYVKQRRQAAATQIITHPDREPEMEKQLSAAQHYATVSSLSLGLSIAGTLTASPLALATIPLNIYTNLPLFEEAIATLAGNDEKRRSIIYSLVISGALASEHFLTATLLDWFIQYTRLFGAKLQQQGHEMTHVFTESIQHWVNQAMGKKPEKVWVVGQDAVDFEIPFSNLQIGDEVLFREGDFISVRGKITFGKAEIFDWSQVSAFAGQHIDPPQYFTVGDTVTPRMMVLKGELHVQVETLT